MKNLAADDAADLVLTNAVELATSEIRRGRSITARNVLVDAIRVADRLLEVA